MSPAAVRLVLLVIAVLAAAVFLLTQTQTRAAAASGTVLGRRRRRDGADAEAGDGSPSAERLLAAACHEMRSPLNAIAGSVAQLHHPSAEVRARAAARIARSVQVQRRLLDGLLDRASLLTQPAEDAQSDLVDVGRLLRAAAAAAGEAAGRRGVAVLASSPVPRVRVRASRGPLAAALDALIRHLLDLAPEGGWVSLRGHAREDRVRIVIAYGPRRQADPATATARPGPTVPNLCEPVADLGVGLAMIQEVVALARGRWETRRAGRRGGQVIITLPLAWRDEPRRLPAPRAARLGAPAGDQDHGARDQAYGAGDRRHGQ